MTANEVRLHIRYTGWASRKLLDAAGRLKSEDLERNTGVSHTSILGTLAHTYFGDRVWYSRAVDTGMGLPVNRDAPPLDQLTAQWTDLLCKWETWADSLHDGDLDRAVTFKLLDGTELTMPLLHILLHVVNHGTLHRGQVVAMIRQLGGELLQRFFLAPPATDLLYYYRELAAARQATA